MCMVTLHWETVGNTYRAKVERGTWGIEQNDKGEYVLWFQANFTRGMLIRGAFSTLDDAKEFAVFNTHLGTE